MTMTIFPALNSVLQLSGDGRRLAAKVTDYSVILNSFDIFAGI